MANTTTTGNQQQPANQNTIKQTTQKQPMPQAPTQPAQAPVQPVPTTEAPQNTAMPLPKEPKKGFFSKLFSKKEKVPKEDKKPEKIKAKKVKEAYKPEFKIEFPIDIPNIPELKDQTKLDVRYKVIDPYVDIHVYWDAKISEILYEVEEPKLTEKQQKDLETLEEGLTELINISFINIENKDIVIEYLEKNLRILLDEFGIEANKETFMKYMYYIYRDFVGMDIAEPLLRDYFIEDIECNGFNSPIYIVHRKYRNLRTNIIFTEMSSLTQFVEKLAQKCGKYVSYANPLLDGVLPDGSRVNATYTEDVTSRGPTFTLRKFTKEPWTPIKLMDFKTVSPEILAYIWIAIENRSNILIIGGTGSGKTSLLNAIAFFIPPAARVVSIEDTRELNLKHENWLPAVSRAGAGMATITGERQGEVTLFDLLKESLRQRPDYIIIGEIRGKEAFVLFQGMNTGHPSFGTMHAESVDTVVKRLIMPPISLSPSMVEALDIVCIITPAKFNGKDVRRIRQIDEIVKVTDKGEAQINTPFVRDPRTDQFMFKTQSVVFQKIMQRTGMTWPQLLKEFQNRARLLMAMYRDKIFAFSEVQEIINQYYKTPLVVLKKFGIK
ncbi:MAG: Flp pilus assembly complex ATPase component TadA [Nanoarchaeota archaeon]|nr:Flp pilus assembly complex ATPase component TadA [Nanoarchaeota archaeon]MBU4456901.1 Flp pilus assembly complex ATPase component TadA [Nanoarchaeota archaeon]MCG2719904.1 Flp pilus assembly complex ATPase component TadA [Nanoarchaeota archaeon]